MAVIAKMLYRASATLVDVETLKIIGMFCGSDGVSARGVLRPRFKPGLFLKRGPLRRSGVPIAVHGRVAYSRFLRTLMEVRHA
jgi:hypothetical protein